MGSDHVLEYRLPELNRLCPTVKSPVPTGNRRRFSSGPCPCTGRASLTCSLQTLRLIDQTASSGYAKTFLHPQRMKDVSTTYFPNQLCCNSGLDLRWNSSAMTGTFDSRTNACGQQTNPSSAVSSSPQEPVDSSTRAPSSVGVEDLPYRSTSAPWWDQEPWCDLGGVLEGTESIGSRSRVRASTSLWLPSRSRSSPGRCGRTIGQCSWTTWRPRSQMRSSTSSFPGQLPCTIGRDLEGPPSRATHGMTDSFL